MHIRASGFPNNNHWTKLCCHHFLGWNCHVRYHLTLSLERGSDKELQYGRETPSQASEEEISDIKLGSIAWTLTLPRPSLLFKSILINAHTDPGVGLPLISTIVLRTGRTRLLTTAHVTEARFSARPAMSGTLPRNTLGCIYSLLQCYPPVFQITSSDKGSTSPIIPFNYSSLESTWRININIVS